MTGVSKIFPPGEAPAAEARAEAALARELAPDSAPLDISLDEAPEEPGRLARGAEAIREFWRHAPLGPGVYRMIGAEGEVLYVGKARSIKKRIAAYMAPERQPSRIARMDTVELKLSSSARLPMVSASCGWLTPLPTTELMFT